MARIKRIVCYAVNGGGMGHITRLLGVARWLRRYVGLLEGRSPEIYFLTSSEATGVLLDANFPSFKLPSKTLVRRAGLDVLEYRRLARGFVWQTLSSFAPDLLVVDTFPSGSFDELLQLLDGPFAKGLILRRVKPDYGNRPTFQAALGLYDVIVAPHDADRGERFGVPPHKPLHFCGEVLQVEREETLSRDEARARLGLPQDARVVYVSAGGGGDPESEAALARSVELLTALDPNLYLLVGAGPLYPGRRLGGPRLLWFTDPGVVRYFPACDAALSAGGYNTFHELLYMRVPSLFFAQEKVADDQAERIREAAALGACRLLPSLDDAPSALENILVPEVAAQMRAQCEVFLPTNGASRCARALLSSVYPDEALAWASGLLTARTAQVFEQAGPEGVQVMARWLPKLVPQEHVAGAVGGAAFQSLLSQLSPQAAREVEALLQRGGPQELLPIRDSLERLVAASAHWVGGLEALMGLVEVAMKKHPLAQEPDPNAWLPWMARLLSGMLDALVVPEGWDTEGVMQIYKIFPKIVDADVAEGFALFRQTLARVAPRKNSAALMHELRVFKFAHPRVTRETLALLGA